MLQKIHHQKENVKYLRIKTTIIILATDEHGRTRMEVECFFCLSRILRILLFFISSLLRKKGASQAKFFLLNLFAFGEHVALAPY
jgi:hypothetical protein